MGRSFGWPWRSDQRSDGLFWICSAGETWKISKGSSECAELQLFEMGCPASDVDWTVDVMGQNGPDVRSWVFSQSQSVHRIVEQRLRRSIIVNKPGEHVMLFAGRRNRCTGLAQ